MEAHSHTHPVRLNIAISGLLILINVYQLLILPLALVPHSPWWLLTLVPLAPLNLTLWYAIHESFHGGLLATRNGNERLGRALAVLFAAPYHVARFGHLMHHRFNRSVLDQPEVYDPKFIGPFRANAVYYFRLFGGLYLGELATFFVFLLPMRRVGPFIHWLLDRDEDEAKKIDQAAQKTLAKPATIKAIRFDLAVTVLLYMVSMILYGPYWFMPLVLIAMRAVTVSFVDNLPHYGTPLDQPGFAYNLSLPRSIELGILNFNRHHTHHNQPTRPWTQLPQAQQEQGVTDDMPYLRAALMQLKGPIPETEL